MSAVATPLMYMVIRAFTDMTSHSEPAFRFTSCVLPTALAFAVPLTMAAQTDAQAVTFRFEYGGGISNEFKAATQEASNAWSSVLKDDTVVDLRIEYTDLSNVGASVLGGAQPGKIRVKYEDYVNALFQDASSSNDFEGLSSLQLSSEGRSYLQNVGQRTDKKADLKSEDFAFLMDGKFSRRGRADFIDNNRNSNNKSVLVTRAQAKALNLRESKKRGLDAVIKINSEVDWDLDPRNGVDSDRYNLSSVIQHEIGHALGIVSGVDTLDFLASSSEPVDFDDEKFSYLAPMDFYRYSRESAEAGVMDLTFGGRKYFSLDGGKSAVRDGLGREAYFSTGTFSSGGDGYQASHWRETDGNPLGVMNPSLQKGETNKVTQLDLALLDVVGWNLEDNNAKRASEIGIYWNQIQGDLAADRQRVVDQAITQWGDEIPELESALADASVEIDLKFRQKMQEKFDKLEEKVEKNGKDRSKEISKFYDEVWKESDKRNEDLSKLPEEIAKLDEKVGDWLYLSTNGLSSKLKGAKPEEINRLSNLVKAAPSSEQKGLESKLSAALSQFVDEPSKVVKELLDSSGPSNPVGFGFGRQWWFALQVSDDFNEDFGDFVDSPTLYLTAAPELDSPSDFAGVTPLSNEAISAASFSSQDSKDVPEPSSVLALFGIAVLGAKVSRKRD